MYASWALAALLLVSARGAELARAVRGQSDRVSLADAGIVKEKLRYLEPEASTGDDWSDDEEDHRALTMGDILTGRGRHFQTKGLEGAEARGDDWNDDEEDHRDLTMADLLSGRGHHPRMNRTSILAGAGAMNTWAHLRGTTGVLGSMEEVPAYETEAWNTVLYARKLGPHRQPVNPATAQEGLHSLLAASAPVDWYFLMTVLGVIVAWDFAILQQLPETSRIHVVLLLFWIMVAVVFCVEVWLRLGPQAGVAWITGYVLELIYSADHIFIIHLLFCTFETPRRLTTKALFVCLLGSVAFRFLLLMGLANVMERLAVIPYIVGLWLVYCGTQQVTTQDDEAGDVTQSSMVRSVRNLLGDRLGEFYDEEGEALFTVQKGKRCMTLLGVVVLSLMCSDFLLAYDVMLTKAEVLPNAYLSFSSSTLALFAVRAAFFALRDLLNRSGVVRYGVGLVLLFMGAETLLCRAIYVNTLMSCAAITLIVAMSVFISWMRGPCPKALQ